MHVQFTNSNSEIQDRNKIMEMLKLHRGGGDDCINCRP